MKLEAAPVILMIVVLGLVLVFQQASAAPDSAGEPAQARAAIAPTPSFAYVNQGISEPAEGISQAVIVRAQPDPRQQ
jgi:hypothetical protein